MKTPVRHAFACALSCLAALVIVAQQQPLPPEASQFDFWIGEWEVTQPDGKVAGNNSIVSINNGRALLENWTSAAGNFSGKSLNSYDVVAKKWKQFWVDTAGAVLELSGGIVDGKMVLSGTTLNQAGGEVHQRITWTPNEDGSVRQHWEQSSDSGTTWQTVFDGHYVKKAAPAKE
ncbi:MAG TPA: hypothetical protein VMM36_19795 [Opitutaceae bacterium]|nr:hypothetical protein [Opitutaceae bacterium]